MTHRRAEKLCGHVIVVTDHILPPIHGKPTPKFDAILECDCGGPDQIELLSRSGLTREEAVRNLTEACYKTHCQIVRRRANNRCENCGKGGPMEIDHVISRAKQGTHEVSNLRLLDLACHRLRHQLKGGI